MKVILKTSLPNEEKNEIINNIKARFYDKFERCYIIGSFFRNKCCIEKSDIDVVIIDKSFESYHMIHNNEYIKQLIKNFPYKLDIFLYTPYQFKIRYKFDERFRNNIEGGLKLF